MSLKLLKTVTDTGPKSCPPSCDGLKLGWQSTLDNDHYMPRHEPSFTSGNNTKRINHEYWKYMLWPIHTRIWARTTILGSYPYIIMYRNPQASYISIFLLLKWYLNLDILGNKIEGLKKLSGWFLQVFIKRITLNVINKQNKN